MAHIAHDLATCAGVSPRLPQATYPRFDVALKSDGVEEVESIASKLRSTWRVPHGPIPDIVGLLESHGIVVMRLPLESADVDAFSLPFPDRPVIVLSADKNDRARSRFDAAHELGHLVMHGEQIWGLPEVEKQAHSFAAAFLMPKRDIVDHLPPHADWARLFGLKRQWQVSLAALLMRARVLGRMSENDYVAAMKACSARGWRRIEPVPLGPPERAKLLHALIGTAAGGECRDVLPKKVIHDIEVAAAA